MKIKNLFLIFVLLGLLTLPYGDTAARNIDRSETSFSPSTTYGWTFTGAQAQAYFGTTWRPAGDVNGDGFDDLIISAHSYDSTLIDAGRAYLFYGSLTGYDPANPDWIVDGDTAELYFGISVSGVGDVNADGFDDVIIGAHKFDQAEPALTNVGKIYLYYGSSDGLSTSPDWTYTGTQAYQYLGQETAGIGDVNGDGFDDFVCSAPDYDGNFVDEGQVLVFYGNDPYPANTPDWTAESDQTNGYFGTSLSGLGDVNDDGYDDLIIGAENYDNGTVNEGAAFAWFGSDSGLGDPGTPTNADWMAESNQTTRYFSESLGTPGDVNNDGFDDVVISSREFSNPTSYEGVVFFWYGSEDGPNQGVSGNPTNANWIAESNNWGYGFGTVTGTPANINGDEYDDVVVGCILGTPGIFVYYGSETGPNLGVTGDLSNADWHVDQPSVPGLFNAWFGWQTGSVGDANGDGIDDIAVVARLYYEDSSNPLYRAGKMWAYYTDAGTVSGTATYTGSQTETGPISVSAHLNLNDSPVSLSDNIESGETYSVGGLDGSYYLIAVLDSDGSGGPPDPGEPIGWYDGDSDGHPDLVDVAAGEHITGKDITLTDPGSISGTVTYIGSLGLSGPIRVTAHLSLVESPIANAEAISSGETYSITGLPAGSYYISAYMDVNDSGGPPDPGEPSAFYDSNADGVPDKVVVSGGDDVTGIDLELDDIRIFLPLILR